MEAFAPTAPALLQNRDYRLQPIWKSCRAFIRIGQCRKLELDDKTREVYSCFVLTIALGHREYVSHTVVTRTADDGICQQIGAATKFGRIDANAYERVRPQANPYECPTNTNEAKRTSASANEAERAVCDVSRYLPVLSWIVRGSWRPGRQAVACRLTPWPESCSSRWDRSAWPSACR